MSNPLTVSKSKDGVLYQKLLEELYPQIEETIFSLAKPQIGYPEDGGVTGYFSQNMKRNDLKLVKQFLDHENIDILNTRAFKTSQNHYIVTVGSIDKS